MKTVAVVYGTRPEAIKLAPVVVELRKIQSIRTILICSGQHKEMLEGIMDLWGLTPDITLKYDFNSGHTSAIPGIMIELEREFLKLVPDFVIVQGDTATAAAAALQAHALHIPVAHVEAGLRSGDLWNPWPEEANRKMIDAISSLHFAPTQLSADNLYTENFNDSVFVTGNTIVDSLNHVVKMLETNKEIRNDLEFLLGFQLEEPFILFTQHRREGFGHGQGQVFQAILELAHLGFRTVMPVHMNPQVREKAEEKFVGVPNISLIDPQRYLSFVELLRMSTLVISDSGGLQEEVPSLGKTILITRLTTERPEVLASGHGVLVGFDGHKIVDEALKAINASASSLFGSNPFGDGESSKKIAQILDRELHLPTHQKYVGQI
jgi:UDP-N-acetylglucosamine 2-epimerase (non-hydrolysing)